MKRKLIYILLIISILSNIVIGYQYLKNKRITTSGTYMVIINILNQKLDKVVEITDQNIDTEWKNSRLREEYSKIVREANISFATIHNLSIYFNGAVPKEVHEKADKINEIFQEQYLPIARKVASTDKDLTREQEDRIHELYNKLYNSKLIDKNWTESADDLNDKWKLLNEKLEDFISKD